MIFADVNLLQRLTFKLANDMAQSVPKDKLIVTILSDTAANVDKVGI